MKTVLAVFFLTLGLFFPYGRSAKAHDLYLYCEPHPERISREPYNDPYDQLHTIHYQLYRPQLRASCGRILVIPGRHLKNRFFPFISKPVSYRIMTRGEKR